MQSISQNFHQTADADPAMGAGVVARLGDVVLGFLAGRDTRLVVRSLSDAQLSDAGIDRADVLGERPVLNVDAALTRYLASLR